MEQQQRRVRSSLHHGQTLCAQAVEASRGSAGTSAEAEAQAGVRLVTRSMRVPPPIFPLDLGSVNKGLVASIPWVGGFF